MSSAAGLSAPAASAGQLDDAEAETPGPRKGSPADLLTALLRHAVKLRAGYSPSGEQLDWFMDCREVLLSGWPLQAAARALWNALRGYSPAAVGGVTLSADPLVAAVLQAALQDGISMNAFLIRKTPKEYGLRKLVEGPPLVAGSRVIVVDDIVGRGDTANWAVDVLEYQGVHVCAVAAVMDFQRGGRQRLERRAIDLITLFTLRDLGLLPRQIPSPLEMRRRWRWAPLNVRAAEPRRSAPSWNAEGTAVCVGDDRGHLAAFHAEAGIRSWRHAIRGAGCSVTAAPLSIKERVVCGARDGYTYCLDEATGRLLWESQLGEYIVATPCADPTGERIFIGSGLIGGSGCLVALALDTGQCLWHRPESDPVECSAWYEAARDLVVYGSNGGLLVGAAAADGHPVWSADLGAPLRGRVTGDREGAVFAISDGGTLHAIDTATGTVRWRRALARVNASSPLCIENMVIAGSGNHLICFDRRDGEVRWIAAVGGQVKEPSHLPRYGAVVAGSTDGTLYLVDATTGGILTRYATGGSIVARAAVYASLVCVPSDDRCLHMVEVTVSSDSGQAEGTHEHEA